MARDAPAPSPGRDAAGSTRHNGGMQFLSRGFLRRRPLLEIVGDGVLIENADLVTWEELDGAGEFVNDLASGLGLRLTDPEEWFPRHTYRRTTVVGSVLSVGQGPKGLGDLMGTTPAVPHDLASRIAWGRELSGGWDLVFPGSALADPPARIADEIMRHKADLP